MVEHSFGSNWKFTEINLTYIFVGHKLETWCQLGEINLTYIFSLGTSCKLDANRGAAQSAKKYDKQFKDYYERKTSEGKNGMLVMNALRCKIISRVFAAIKRETPYVDFLKYSA